jgi:LysR family transcriptional regulator, transcriptional activator of the cysJI operon
MELEARLRAFAAVARTHSFSRAAEALHISQPAISKHIAALEDELDTKLLARTRSGAHLTPAGKVVADYVLRAEGLLSHAKQALAGGVNTDPGTLTVAASPVPATYLLPDVLADLQHRHPAIAIDIRVASPADAVDLVRTHRAELAVVSAIEPPPELQSEPLVEDEIVIVGAPSLASRRLRADDLEKLTWIVPDAHAAARAAEYAARAGIRQIQTLEVPGWEAAKRAVSRGAGVTAISRIALDTELRAGVVAVLDVPAWRQAHNVTLMTERDAPLTPPGAAFVDALRCAIRHSAANPRQR